MYSDSDWPTDHGTDEERRHIYSVGELNEAARDQLETEFASIWVTGELHEIRRPGTGHWYMTLKGEKAQLNCVMFIRDNQKVAQPPKQGDQINIRGELSIYSERGQYQLIAREMEPAGEGLLLRRFAELSNLLKKEGLFDDERKQPLPEFPHHIAVITSDTGAAIRDVLSVTERRAPLMRLTLIPAVVQGDAAAPSLCRAMDICEQWNSNAAAEDRFDALLLCRGGGSLTDLWAFNEEAVVRRIARLQLPCISGVGHEVDFTLCDFAADRRAPTPSAAAEILTEQHVQQARRLAQTAQQLNQEMGRQLARQQEQLEGFAERLLSPQRQVENNAQHLDDLLARMQATVKRQQTQRQARLQELASRLISPVRQLERRTQNLNELAERLQLSGRRSLADAHSNLRSQREKLLHLIQPIYQSKLSQLEEAAATLAALNPSKVLQRGYAIVYDAQGRVLYKAADTAADENIEVRLASGELSARITATRPPKESA